MTSWLLSNRNDVKYLLVPQKALIKLEMINAIPSKILNDWLSVRDTKRRAIANMTGAPKLRNTILALTRNNWFELLRARNPSTIIFKEKYKTRINSRM